MIARAGTTVGRFDRIRVALPCLVVFAALLIAAAAAYAQAPKVAPITIVINQSPWFASFSKAVDAYEKATGNKVTLDVNPFAGSAEKQRNSVRAKDGQFDLLVMNSNWLAEFFHGGFLTPLADIDPSFRIDPAVINYDDTAYWDAITKRNSAKTGVPYGVPINGNIQVLYYRADLYEKAGLEVPQTWEELVANAAKLHQPPAIYGMVQRGARSASDISYDWMPYLHGCNGAIFRDEKAGDYTVTINSPEAKKALDFYVELGEEVRPAESGQLRTGAGDPGAADRQGGARDAGDRRVAAGGRSHEVRGRRQGERRRAAALPGRQKHADARALHRRHPEEHSEGSTGGGARVPALVPDL